MALATSGPKPGGQEGTIIGQLGGVVNYSIFSFWLFLSYAGWAIAIASLSAIQNYENTSGLSASNPNAPYGGWAIKANYPGLNSAKVFRFDWWVVFYQLLVSSLVTLSVLTRVLSQARISVAGFVAVAIVLGVLSTDRFFNLEHLHVNKAYYSSSRSAFAGYLIATTADFGLLYHIGLSPSPE